MHGTINIELKIGGNHLIGGMIIGPRHIISVMCRETIKFTALKNGTMEGAISYHQTLPLCLAIPVKEVHYIESSQGKSRGSIVLFLLEKTLPKSILYKTLLDTDLVVQNSLPDKVKLTGWNRNQKSEIIREIDKKKCNGQKFLYTKVAGSIPMGGAIWIMAHEKIKVLGFHCHKAVGIPITTGKLEKIDKWIRTTDMDKSTGKEINELDGTGKMSKAQIRGITIDVCDMERWPWHTHGLLRLMGKPKSPYASATIIGPRHLVTAQHNLAHSVATNDTRQYAKAVETYIKQQGQPPTEGYWPCFTGESLGKADNPENYEPHKPLETIFEENRLTKVWQGGAIGDIALLTFKDNLEESIIKNFLSDDLILEPITRENLPPGTPVFIAGYPNNKNGRMWFAKGMVLSTGTDVFYFSCDTVGTGSSGSAIWTYEGVFNGVKRRRLVGINSGGVSDEPGSSRGALINKKIYRKLKNWLDYKKKVVEYTRELNCGPISNRIKSAGKLGDMESLAVKAIPELLNCLSQADNGLKEEAARALGKICANVKIAKEPHVRNMLITMLEFKKLNEKVKFAMAMALISVNSFEAARYFESIDRLKIFVGTFEETGNDEDLRVSAVQALGIIGSQFSSIESNKVIIAYVCQKLLQVLDDQSQVLKKAALTGLAAMKLKAVPAGEKLVVILGREPGNLLDMDIMYALGAIIPSALEKSLISMELAKRAVNKINPLKGSSVKSVREAAHYTYPIIKLAIIKAQK
ncbi:MAG: hypothetical protein GY710_12635 [Desulfobacteraceae bacterium]|nr:hypothetical protein [Desulfobacteraceae bacterium]